MKKSHFGDWATNPFWSPRKCSKQGWLDGFQFMVFIGMGLYMPYVAVHTTIFERWIAMTGDRGNIGFLMYLADSFGYMGYVAVMLARGSSRSGEVFLDFFVTISWVVAGSSLALLIGCWIYFTARIRQNRIARAKEVAT